MSSILIASWRSRFKIGISFGALGIVNERHVDLHRVRVGNRIWPYFRGGIGKKSATRWMTEHVKGA